MGPEACLARTGYTGGDGFELFLPDHHAVRLWEAILAAALVPIWTRPLAARIGGELPLDAMAAQGWLDAHDGRYAMRRAVRPDRAEQALRERPEIDLPALARELAEQILVCDDVPAATRRWATLARHATDPDHFREALFGQIDERLRAGDDPGAYRLVQAARLLEWVLGGPGRVVVEGAARRLAYHHRLRADAQLLESYIDRAEPTQAVVDGAGRVLEELDLREAMAS